ncbi:hypothetical protein K505DRAFT_127855 [Melanomma pulvis-pyrius CBS 109.77]|uniref:F-box domain-containing protein n=1 Tax=Melanomma pulvis-pyrius CBS 109.77 TaxID=1314802 RepID=A0A6A6XP29_9PLEO|nr:hypothetical protein K505DRAFT_127855 [Melanomma pulvis-pyrius CBS 109.77]
MALESRSRLSTHQYYPSKDLTVLPCAHALAYCTEHSAGRIEPKKPTNSIIHTVLAGLCGFRFSKVATTNQTCHLRSLPIELIGEIALHLTLPERIAFTLTCKALYSALGTSPFSGYKRLSEEECLKLLIPLQRDNPEYRICSPCKILHSRNTIAIPSSEPEGKTFPLTLKVYLIAPGRRRDPDPLFLYWVTDEHIRRIISRELCIWTLRCFGTFSLSEELASVPELHDTTFRYMMAPNRNRHNFVFYGIHEFSFTKAPHLRWSESGARGLLKNFDIRCCVHCSTELMMDELVCALYHGRGSPDSAQGGSTEGCARVQNDPFGDGCGHHFHDCECATEYKIERPMDRREGEVVLMRVFVWQWLGGNRDDAQSRKRGMVRRLHESAAWDDIGFISGPGHVFHISD